MKLSELQPKFVRVEIRQDAWQEVLPDGTLTDVTGPRNFFIHVEKIEDAQGVEFLCPACFRKNNGEVGTHMTRCWSRSRGVPDNIHPGPGRWTLVGTGLHDLTLNGDPPNSARSIQCPCWHGFITNGEVTDA